MSAPANVDPARAADSNFGNMMAVNGTFCGLAILTVTLRVYVRFGLIKSFGWDDAVMVLALMFLVGGGLVPQIVAGMHGALGRHADTVTTEEMKVYGMMSFVQGVLMTVTSHCLVKVSIALSLLRLNRSKWYQWTLWGFIGFIGCYWVIGWVSLIAYCNPIKAHWDTVAFKTAKCYPRDTLNAFASLNTGLNIFTDICFATLPIPMLWSLQMKRRIKYYLIAIFNLGYCAVILGIVKLVCQLVTRGETDKT
ncbi:hypothetical protein GQ53DRAFT_648621 [Thozetella sp. PMI_491]|nr:hypothetical protein GQ53DRAFT_648621 [Thozetella sp. PMI_491]